MTIYNYNNIASADIVTWNEEGDTMISGIHYDVMNSEMNDKDIDCCRWDEDESELKLWFDNSLSAEDKDILDNIIDDNST